MAVTVDDVAKLLNWDPADQRHALEVLQGTWPAMRDLLGVIEAGAAAAALDPAVQEGIR